MTLHHSEYQTGRWFVEMLEDVRRENDKKTCTICGEHKNGFRPLMAVHCADGELRWVHGGPCNAKFLLTDLARVSPEDRQLAQRYLEENGVAKMDGRTNQLRFRSGQVFLLKFPVLPETIIYSGDLIFMDKSGFAHPLCDLSYKNEPQRKQIVMGHLTKWFAGIAHQLSEEGETYDISVDVSPNSVYEFDVIPSEFMIGDFLHPAVVVPAEGEHYLNPQKLERATITCETGPSIWTRNTSIARTVEYKRGKSPLVRVSFASAFHVGSSNVHAQIGGEV